LNILHIWDQSGVACILAKYQKKIGHNAKVLRRSNYDPYGIYEYYRDLVEFVDEKDYLDKCVSEATRADVVHIHSRTDALQYLKKKLEKEIKLIMHFHGSDLRGIKQNFTHQKITSIPKLFIKNYNSRRIRERNNLLAENYADRIILSTPDLQEKIKMTIPIVLDNPVDTEHFCKSVTMSNGASKDDIFTFSTEATSNTNWIINYCKNNGINSLHVIDRTKSPIRYSKMPDFLQKFSTYVDIRYVNNSVLHNLSKTALESLACGLKVIDHELKCWTVLPSVHEPANVAKRSVQIYEEI
jgi:hypothetical protein